VTGVRGGAGGSPDSLRALNRSKIIAALHRLRAASRADLSQATGLSRGTVASIVTELQHEGIVRSGERDDLVGAAPGRPPTLLRLAPPTGLAVAVDVGHTHVRVAIGDAEASVLEERFVELPDTPKPEQLLAVAADLVADVSTAQHLANRGIVAAAVGLPAPLDLDGHSMTARFRGIDIAAATGLARLTDRVVVMNDADLGAIGEAAFGAGRGLDDFVFVKLSHGLGAGLVLGGRLYRGAAGLAGNLGHVRVREDGEVCICGNRGCLETLVAARRLVAALQPAHPDRRLEVADLLQLVRDGDLGARVLVNDAGAAVGRTLAEIVNVLNPAAIVVGGVLSALGEPLLQGIGTSISRYSQAIAAATLKVVPAECGPRAEVLGGLAVALEVIEVSSGGRTPDIDKVSPIGA
jgi:predicted NBD/HSP70 family sugar kinase